MGRVQAHHDPSPPLTQGKEGEHSENVFFPPGAVDLINPAPSAASNALNITVHLLQKYTSQSHAKPGRIAPSLSPSKSQPTSTLTAMSSESDPVPQRRKLCFVTVGATAPFDSLIQAVQTPKFLSALEATGFTNLLIQHGHEGDVRPAKDAGSVRITSFDFRKDGIHREVAGAKGDIRKAKAELKSSKILLEGLDFGTDWQNATWEEGCVISHAGSGSILDALRTSAPLIVVPNESLLDNHQLDLARELAKQGYVVHGHLDKLDESLAAIESLRQKRRQWPPPLDPNDKGGRGLIGIMDEEMGYTDLKSQTKGSRLYLD